MTVCARHHMLATATSVEGSVFSVKLLYLADSRTESHSVRFSMESPSVPPPIAPRRLGVLFESGQHGRITVSTNDKACMSNAATLNNATTREEQRIACHLAIPVNTSQTLLPSL